LDDTHRIRHAIDSID